MSEEAARVLYRKYLNSAVADKLINYYASEDTFAKIQNAVAVVEFLPNIVSVLPSIDFGTVKKLIDNLVTVDPATNTTRLQNLGGLVDGAFYLKIADIVGNHDNLLWYSNVNVITTAKNLFDKATDILDIANFIKGTTSGGSSRWTMLQNYLDDSLYGNISHLVGEIGGIDSWITWLSSRSANLQYFVDYLQNIPASASVTGHQMTRITTDLDLWDGSARRKLLVGDIDSAGLFNGSQLSLGGLSIDGLASALKTSADAVSMAWSDMANGLGYLGQVKSKIKDHLDFSSTVSSDLSSKLGSKLTIAWDYDFYEPLIHYQAWYVDSGGNWHQGPYSGSGRDALDTWLRTVKYEIDVKTGAKPNPGLGRPIEDAVMTCVQGMQSVFSNFFDMHLDVRNWSDKLGGIPRSSPTSVSSVSPRTRLLPSVSDIRNKIADRIRRKNVYV